MYCVSARQDSLFPLQYTIVYARQRLLWGPFQTNKKKQKNDYRSKHQSWWWYIHKKKTFALNHNGEFCTKKIQSIVKLRAYDIGWTVYVSDTRCEGNNGGGLWELGSRTWQAIMVDCVFLKRSQRVEYEWWMIYHTDYCLPSNAWEGYVYVMDMDLLYGCKEEFYRMGIAEWCPS